METVPKNCISFRTNICGNFITTQDTGGYYIQYIPSELFRSRCINDVIIGPLTDVTGLTDMLKKDIIALFNSRKDSHDAR